MSSDLRIAIIGAGRMGQTHIRNLSGITGVSISVVADTVSAAAEQGAAIARAERATIDIAGTISASDVDAVIISTPTSTHADLMIKAAQAKKAIWCEKPVALSLAETQRVVQAVKENNVPVQLGFMRRYDPGYAAAKRKIDTGEVGRIETFRAISRDNKLPPISYLKTSGGIFLDMAVHDFDLARFLVGEVEEVQCWGTVLADPQVKEIGDIDTAMTMLRFVNGALGVMETTRRTTWGYDIRTEVAGSLGKVVVDGHQKTPMTFSRNGGFEGDYFESFPDRFEDGYRLEMIAFIEALREGRTPSPDLMDALETQRLALAATKSWREGRAVKVSEI